MAKKSHRKIAGKEIVSTDVNSDILTALVTTLNRQMDVLEKIVLGPQKADLLRAVDQTIAHYAFGEIEDRGMGSGSSADRSLVPDWEHDPEMVDEDNGRDEGLRGLSVVDISDSEVG